MGEKKTRYEVLIGTIFQDHYRKGSTGFEFHRSEIETAAQKLVVKLPKNLGDLIYSFRYRRPLPPEIIATETSGREWVIEAAGVGKYRFRLAKINRIVPQPDLLAVKVPDATPEIIVAYALTDEQSLLARVRYNRWVDIFLGIVTYSLQNHLRTTVIGLGQIEIDEVYVGVSQSGQQFVVPIQAKGGSDKLGAIQTNQDIACCAEKFPHLTCRPISAQFMADGVIAMMELTLLRGELKIVQERHYRLVPASAISAEEMKLYSLR